MLGDSFRPWGEFNWLLNLSEPQSWNVIGCISFEDRCCGLQNILTSGSHDVQSTLYTYINPPNTPQADSQLEKLRKNKYSLFAGGVTPADIRTYNLLSPVETFLTDCSEFVKTSNGNILLDITCFPKRFFFPMIKQLVREVQVKNLIVTYTKPSGYTDNDLSGDPSEWAHIPTFIAEDFEKKAEVAVIGVGFVPLGLSQLLVDEFQDAEVRLLFPYPPGPPNFQRNWEFVRQIEDSLPSLNPSDMRRVHTLDMSDAFDQIDKLTNGGELSALLAPYGPKPISVAMALHATKYDAPVYYTQPNYYAHDYSFGIKETYGYWLKFDGNNLY